MSNRLSIPSREAAATIAEEDSIGTLPVTPVWNKLPVTSFGDFSAQVTKSEGNVFDPSRMPEKGATIDVDAPANVSIRFAHEALVELMQGFLFADLRKKDEVSATAVVDSTTDSYTVASGGAAYTAGDLLFAQGFDDPANNGLKVVTGTPTGTSIPVSDTLVAATGQTGTLRRVGVQFASGDAEIDATGTWPALKTTTKDLTGLGLIAGEDIFIGGDATAEKFATAADNGFARIRSIATNAIELDKTQAAAVTDTGTGKTIRVFFAPRIIKNESDASLIKRRTYQIEQKLGAPDASQLSQIQAKYAVGAVPGTLAINMPTAQEITADLGFTATTIETRDAATGVKSGTRPTGSQGEVYNTSGNVKGGRIAKVDDASVPTALMGIIREMTLNISNNLTGNKGHGFVGPFEVSEGNLAITGDITAFLVTLVGQKASIDNESWTAHRKLVAQNQGISIDLPLITLAASGTTIEQGQAITESFSFTAYRGNLVHPDLDHMILIGWWDYLPDAAEA